MADLRVVVNTTIPTLHPLLSRHHLEVRQADRQAGRKAGRQAAAALDPGGKAASSSS